MVHVKSWSSSFVLVAALVPSLHADERFTLVASIEPKRPFVGEVFVLRLELNLGADLAREQIVARTLRRLGLPAEWSSGLLEVPGVEFVAPLDASGTDSTVLDGAVVRGTWRTSDERGEHFVLEVAARALQPVHVQLAPRIELAVAESFTTDVFGSSQPLAVATLEAFAPPIDFVPRALPPPVDGAAASVEIPVGTFTLAVAPPANTHLAVDENLTLVATVRGERNLDRVPEPTLELGSDFHLVGALAERSAHELVVRYELVVLEGGTLQTPRAVLDVFDPAGGGQYVRLVSERFDLDTASPAGTSADDSAQPGPRDDSDAVSPSAPEGGDRWARAAIGALVLLAVVIGVATTVRRKRGRAELPSAARVAFEAASGSGDAVAAFRSYIAQITSLPAGARQGTRLVAALEDCGCDRALAERSARFVEQDIVARYAGAPTEPSDGAANARMAGELVQAIEAARRARPGSH